MIQKTLYYYHPTLNRLVTIPGTWPSNVREAQVALLCSQGYGEVINFVPPRSQMPFAVVESSYVPNGDGSFSQQLTSRSLPIRLSQDKLLRHPAIQSRLGDLMDSLAGDPDLASWWLSDTRYLRGSEMASRAMEVFGLSQQEMEQIVLACRI